MGDKGPSDNYALLGAIVVSPSGPEYFFKLTGPAATIKAARAPFYALLDSMREQGGTPEPKKADAKAAKPGATKADAKPAAAATSAPKTAAAKPSTKP